MMRIALGGIATESCTFSPVLTKKEDFNVVYGDALLEPEHYSFLTDAFLADNDLHLFPTLRARALPGGPVERSAYEGFKADFLARLRAALPLDGLYLDMHGAMNVEGLDDAEGDWYEAARRVVGPTCLISASYDLHGNLSQRIIDTLDLLTAYRTAPHVDTLETRTKAFTLLVHCLKENIRPHKVWISVPVLLPGERTSTEYEPAASLYASLPEVDGQPGILDASVLVGYVWADEPRAAASIVVTGTDLDVAEREARRLAQAYWELRDAFEFSVPAGTMDESLGWALETDKTCLFISDSGDNPTAGGVGDRVDFLRCLLEHNIPDAVLGGLTDAAATDACYRAGVGDRLELSLGATLDPRSEPLKVTGEVLFLDAVSDASERQAVLQIGGVTVILARRRRPYHLEADFLRLGIDPKTHKLIVVKVGYLVPDLKRIAGGTFLALSPGAVDQHVERLNYERVRRPLYPLERSFSWEPRAVRG